MSSGADAEGGLRNGNAEDLEALQLIADQAPEGMGVPASGLESWIDVATIRNLELGGLVEMSTMTATSPSR